MEIMVSTAIFVGVLTLMLVLFNFTLRINRKVEALRQVSQATRNFTEFLVREIRNGTLDYSGTIDPACPTSYNTSTNTSLALVNRTGDRQCFFLVTNAQGTNLWVTKRSINGTSTTEQVNPNGVRIDPAFFRIFVRPTSSPQVSSGGSYPGVQPFVTLIMRLSVQLSGGEQAEVIPYQTTVSTDVYTIPHR